MRQLFIFLEHNPPSTNETLTLLARIRLRSSCKTPSSSKNYGRCFWKPMATSPIRPLLHQVERLQLGKNVCRCRKNYQSFRLCCSKSCQNRSCILNRTSIQSSPLRHSHSGTLMTSFNRIQPMKARLMTS